MKIKVDLDLEVKEYFIMFFETYFSTTPIYQQINKKTACFEIIVDNQNEFFVVEYDSLFAQKSSLQIQSTAPIPFLDTVFKLLFNDLEMDYNNRLLFVQDEINIVNAKFKFFNQVLLDNETFFNFKRSFNKLDNRTYHRLCTKRYFTLIVNDNLYSIKRRYAHFLMGRFSLDLNVNSKKIEFKFQLTTNSLDIYVAHSVIELSERLDKFQKSVKRCKKHMTMLISNECFCHIVTDHNIALKKLHTMSEKAIKPYADLVYMSRI
jgi:hypothetical protein